MKRFSAPTIQHHPSLSSRRRRRCSFPSSQGIRRPMEEAQLQNITQHPSPSVKATFRLGSETYLVQADKGILSDQLVSMKAESMVILKDFITRHNVPTDVPDEPDEPSSEDEGEIPVKSKKRK